MPRRCRCVLLVWLGTYVAKLSWVGDDDERCAVALRCWFKRLRRDTVPDW